MMDVIYNCMFLKFVIFSQNFASHCSKSSDCYLLFCLSVGADVLLCLRETNLFVIVSLYYLM